MSSISAFLSVNSSEEGKVIKELGDEGQNRGRTGRVPKQKTERLSIQTRRRNRRRRGKGREVVRGKSSEEEEEEEGTGRVFPFLPC